MKASTWLRSLTAVFVAFTAGHTAGTLTPPSNPAAADVLNVMGRVRFPAMGFVRSYAEFYRGFGLFVSVEFLFLAAFAYQVSVISRRDPAQAMPLAATLLAACVASAVLSWEYFFTAPIVMSVAAVVCAGGAVLQLRRELAYSEIAVAG